MYKDPIFALTPMIYPTNTARYFKLL